MRHTDLVSPPNLLSGKGSLPIAWRDYTGQEQICQVIHYQSLWKTYVLCYEATIARESGVCIHHDEHATRIYSQCLSFEAQGTYRYMLLTVDALVWRPEIRSRSNRICGAWHELRQDVILGV